jgi:DNA polymerase I-like protein with 3'-5' exonuclease and polymerase domains
LIKEQSIPLLNPATLVPALNPILVNDGKTLDQLKKYLATPRTYVMDYETNCVETFYQRRARTLQVGDRDVQYVIDLLAFAETPERLWAAQGGYRRDGVLLNKRWDHATHAIRADGGFDRVAVDAKTLQPVVDVLRPSLDSDEWLKVGHNLEFEYIVSKWCLGIRAWHFFCTQSAERIIHNGAVPAMLKGFYGLGDLVRRYCRFEIDKSSQTTFDLETPLTEKQIVYCALDVRLPLAIKAAQEVKLKKASLQWVTQIENDAIPAFGDLHLNGVYVNPTKWQKIIDDNKAALVEAVKEIDKFFLPIVGAKRFPNPDEAARLKAVWKGLQVKSQKEKEISAAIRACKSNPAKKAELVQERATVEAERLAQVAVAKAAYAEEAAFCTKTYEKEFEKYEGRAAINFNSPTQVLAALHAGGFGLNAKNFSASNDKAMERHANLPVIKAIREHRGVKQSLKMYGDRWITTRDRLCTIGAPRPGFVDPDTGRIHAKFNQNGTDTGRPSCTNPNLLNISHDEVYREAFESRPGFDLVAKDCSGQELRVLTQYSREPSWVYAFSHGQDIHSVSTQMIVPELWKANTIEATCAFLNNNKAKCNCPGHKKIRNDYKKVTLGIIMGLAAHSLGIQLGVSTEEAQEKIDSWMRTFKYNHKAIVENQKVSYDRGEARTLTGRRRLMDQVTYEQAKKKAFEKYGDNCDQQKITKMMASLVAAVKREGGNVCYQGSSADFMKRAIGCGFDKDGKPYLWHILEPQYGALLENYIYDELVTESPEENSEAVGGVNGVGGVVSDAIIRAGAEVVTVVPMESEGNIAKTWSK